MDTDGKAEGIGLAHAFLLGGATAVIAPTRPVADEDAANLIAALYSQWKGSGDIVAALQRAQRDVKQATPGADWSSFRALVR